MMYDRKVSGCRLTVSACLFALCAVSVTQRSDAADSDQQIGGFSLVGYGEQGKKNWDLSGKTADIFQETVKMKNVEGNLYGKEEDVRLTADKGDFNKADGKVHLEDNVVVTTSSGAKLTTDSLDWDRKAQLVTTDDDVNISKENMTTVGKGIKGEPDLKTIALEKDVRVDIGQDFKAREEAQQEALNEQERITITCDGPLDINYATNIATFNKNVKVKRADSVIYSDKMDVYFITAGSDKEKSDPATSSIDKIVAKGNVKIVRGENVSYSEEAVYTGADKKITLIGRPKLVINSTQGFNDASFGN